MKASETNFQPIIEGTKQYVVPLFQRAYSWNKKEWEVLWDDLNYLCENVEPKSHFIGSIVTMPTVSIPEGVSKFLLIDGQQRLTTIFILLTLLRDIAKETDNQALSDEINQTMLVNPFKKGIDYFKLLPTQVDRNMFHDLIQCQNKHDSQIHQCYQYFDRRLRKTGLDPVIMTKVITSRLSVVSIVLDHDDNPHLVFESLNAKGRPLTQSDLIRNYFFMRIHVDEQDEIHTRYWEPMQSALGDSLTEFIRHYLMRNGSIVKQSDVYFTLKDRVGQANALVALKEMHKFAGYYEKLIEPDKESNRDIRVALKRVNRLEVTTAYPFLLNCYQDFLDNKLSHEDFSQILKLIENFVTRRFVCNVSTNELNKIFPQLYDQAALRSPGNLVEGVRQILQTRNYPKDNEFRSRLVESKLYGAGERAIKTKMILETIEESYEHKEQVPFEDLTIEHIMPQTLTDEWQQYLGQDWLADHELFLHTLGNLTLTAYNSELSNDSYQNKRERFTDSHIVLNRYFDHVNKWDRDAIETRSKHMAEVALQVWPYFGDEQSGTKQVTDSVTGKIPKILIILGQKIYVTSWRDVLTKTMEVLVQLESDAFESLVREYPRLISQDPNRFRRNRQLSNGYYIEINLSARDIYRFCNQAIEAVGLSREDWEVESE